MNKTTLNRQKEKHSMLSLRRATSSAAKLLTYSSFLSTLSLRRATYRYTLIVGDVMISIHALLAESDYFNAGALPYDEEFLSTLSLRRATHGIFQRSNGRQFLSTLSLRRATFLRADAAILLPISIHALLAESDWVLAPQGKAILLFLSTLSLRRATAANLSSGKSITISIHALLAESDALPPER